MSIVVPTVCDINIIIVVLSYNEHLLRQNFIVCLLCVYGLKFCLDYSNNFANTFLSFFCAALVSHKNKIAEGTQ